MPRRREVPKREILPDPVYNSQLVTKFINSLMSQGKKSVAQEIFYGAMAIAEEKAGVPAIEIFEKALQNAMPAVDVPSRNRALLLSWYRTI